MFLKPWCISDIELADVDAADDGPDADAEVEARHVPAEDHSCRTLYILDQAALHSRACTPLEEAPEEQVDIEQHRTMNTAAASAVMTRPNASIMNVLDNPKIIFPRMKTIRETRMTGLGLNFSVALTSMGPKTAKLTAYTVISCPVRAFERKAP